MKPPIVKLESQAYKIALISVTTLGLITFSYYKAMMNAALNVEVDNIPFKSWEDVSKSDYKIIVLMGSSQEDRFKKSPKGSIMNNIHKAGVLKLFR